MAAWCAALACSQESAPSASSADGASESLLSPSASASAAGCGAGAGAGACRCAGTSCSAAVLLQSLGSRMMARTGYARGAARQ